MNPNLGHLWRGKSLRISNSECSLASVVTSKSIETAHNGSVSYLGKQTHQQWLVSSLLGIALLVTSAEAHMQLSSLLDAVEDSGMSYTVDGKCTFIRTVSGERAISMTNKKDIFPSFIKKIKILLWKFQKEQYDFDSSMSIFWWAFYMPVTASYNMHNLTWLLSDTQQIPE